MVSKKASGWYVEYIYIVAVWSWIQAEGYIGVEGPLTGVKTAEGGDAGPERGSSFRILNKIGTAQLRKARSSRRSEIVGTK